MKNLYKTLYEIQTKLKVPKNRLNDFSGFSYRNAEDILEAAKPLLPDGVSVVVNNNFSIAGSALISVSTASLVNENGAINATAYAREADSAKGMSAPQISGAAISYSKKYALCNLFAIDESSLDPDAHEATTPEVGKQILWQALKNYAARMNEALGINEYSAKTIADELFKDKPAELWDYDDFIRVAETYEEN